MVVFNRNSCPLLFLCLDEILTNLRMAPSIMSTDTCLLYSCFRDWTEESSWGDYCSILRYFRLEKQKLVSPRKKATDRNGSSQQGCSHPFREKVSVMRE